MFLYSASVVAADGLGTCAVVPKPTSNTAGADGIAAGAIAEALGVPASSMSFHLAQLTHSGLITQRRQSRSLIYSADYAAMNRLMGYLTENCCGGAACIDQVGVAPHLKATLRNAGSAL